MIFKTQHVPEAAPGELTGEWAVQQPFGKFETISERRKKALNAIKARLEAMSIQIEDEFLQRNVIGTGSHQGEPKWHLAQWCIIWLLQIPVLRLTGD